MKKIFLVAAMAAVVLTCVNAQNKYQTRKHEFLDRIELFARWSYY